MWDFATGTWKQFYFCPNQFSGEVLSSPTIENQLRKKKVSTFLSKSVFGRSLELSQIEDQLGKKNGVFLSKSAFFGRRSLN